MAKNKVFIKDLHNKDISSLIERTEIQFHVCIEAEKGDFLGYDTGKRKLSCDKYNILVQLNKNYSGWGGYLEKDYHLEDEHTYWWFDESCVTIENKFTMETE